MVLLFKTKNFNSLDTLKDKINFFITTMISTEEEKLHFKIQVSKPISYIAQNQINIKMNHFSLPFKFYIQKKGGGGQNIT